jgi:modulator of FtsH protease HflK
MQSRNTINFDLRDFRPPKIPLRLVGIGVLILFGLITLYGSFYQVEPEEVGMVLRFGRYIRTTNPGLHGKIPFLEEVLKVPVQRQLKQEFGYRTIESGIRSQYATAQFADESLMLTGDLNVAIVEWIVQYRVSDPYKYLFRVRNVTETFRDMNEAMMREVIGDRTVTEVLTVGRQEIEMQVMLQLQELCDQYETGITVDQIVLQDVNPPDPVKPSWDEVNQAQQQRDRLINEARAEYNEVVPRARGEAEQLVLQAEGYAVDRTNRAEGDAARFKALYEAYRRAPEVTRKRMYLETMQRVLPRMGGKLLLDDSAEGVLPLLPLDMLQRIAPGETRREVGGSQ